MEIISRIEIENLPQGRDEIVTALADSIGRILDKYPEARLQKLVLEAQLTKAGVRLKESDVITNA